MIIASVIPQGREPGITPIYRRHPTERKSPEPMLSAGPGIEVAHSRIAIQIYGQGEADPIVALRREFSHRRNDCDLTLGTV